MRAVVQRVSRAAVRVDGNTVGEIGPGLVVLVGVGGNDTADSAAAMAGKIATLRIFPDEGSKMNRALTEAGGAVLAVSQFTLFGDVRKGRRPSFIAAAPPEVAEPLYEKFLECLRGFGLQVESGVFRARMEVELVNDGPVTILLDTDRLF
ncbi:MAG: D-tyrosyl-tRNA(Tyr) deacylase [Acidobacteria bacterium]|nr:D-tyrosyl-tRNA(Tyr) deacylase [Acidobacteriota bacterium]